MLSSTLHDSFTNIFPNNSFSRYIRNAIAELERDHLRKFIQVQVGLILNRV